MARTATVTPGKTSFVKEFLNDHADATARDVNEAWTKAGMQGTISHPVISEVRRKLGMIGKPRTKGRNIATTETVPAKKRRGRKPGTRNSTTSAVGVETRTQETTRSNAFLAIEIEIDRLIFQVMGIGNLTDVETALRTARRALYKALSS
jgi:hypothetical protein